ncbi:MAG TPA: hypothetical protein VFJ58_20525 [Armatimonadota bacterium]|nr:hypothetical protein [Armatimonadota bacterium]
MVTAKYGALAGNTLRQCSAGTVSGCRKTQGGTPYPDRGPAYRLIKAHDDPASLVGPGMKPGGAILDRPVPLNRRQSNVHLGGRVKVQEFATIGAEPSAACPVL